MLGYQVGSCKSSREALGSGGQASGSGMMWGPVMDLQVKNLEWPKYQSQPGPMTAGIRAFARITEARYEDKLADSW